MNKWRSLLVGAVFALLVAVLLAGPVPAAAKGHQTKAKGTITAIDATGGTVTILDRKSNLEVTVVVNESTRVHKDNKERATLADLAVGDKADARYDVRSMVAKRIQAKSPRLQGTITAIDLEAQSVTIQPKSGSAVTVFATASTKIERDDAPATLADFVVGDHGQAKYNGTTFEAYKIEATSQ